MNLFYLSGNTTGGWVTYTAHLMYGMQQIGEPCNLYKVGNRTERNLRKFGYNLQYQNLKLEEAIRRVCDAPSVIVALQKNFRGKCELLLKAGAWMVVHDPAEFCHLKQCLTAKLITIRRAVQQQLSGSKFVPHPYERQCNSNDMDLRSIHACSIARIDFDKHTTILLDANRLLPKRRQIQIHGFENRLYTRFKICPNYPEWKQSKCAYPREKDAAVSLCRSTRFAIDMSIIKGDGGGSQYTFMESADAGAANVIHRDWIISEDEMIPWPGKEANCFAVSNGKELASLLLSRKIESVRKQVVQRGYLMLSNHNPSQVATEFLRVVKQ